MPVVPVLPNFSSAGAAPLSAWSLWQRGRITAANVTWSVDASDPGAQQNFLLSQLAVNRGYNAIRLVLSAGNSDAAWDDMLLISVSGWNPTTVSSSGDTTAIANVPRLSSGVPVGDIIDGSSGTLIEKGIAGQIDDICVKCAKLGLGVILDVHDFFQRNDSHGFIGPIWQQSQTVAYGAQLLRDQLVALWQNTVQRWGPTAWAQASWTVYENNGVTGHYPCPIIGYEILNEPAPDPALTFAQMQGTDNGKDVDDNNWYSLADRCIKAIRQYDTSTPIVVDAIYYGDAYGLKYFEQVGLLNDYTSSGAVKATADARIVYSFHVYSPQEFTHQGVNDGLYESLGTPYPLSGALVRSTIYDGSSAAVAANNGSTAQTQYLPFGGRTDLLARLKPAIDFKTNHPTVPLFVGEFSAVNPALIKSTQVDPNSSDRRVITAIEVDSSTRVAKAWLGHLTGGFNINIFPFGQSYPAPGYGGAYSDFAKATIKVTDSANASYEVTDVDVHMMWGGDRNYVQFTYPSLPSGTLLGVAGGGNTSSPQVATLTLNPRATASAIDDSRKKYIQDVLQICLDNYFSWGYWAEDGYVADASTIDTLPSGVFIGWRPSPAMSSVLTLAATRRTVSKS